jgi:hypothetical protein
MEPGFCRDIFEKKKTQLTNFMEVHPVRVKFHVDRETDMTKLIVAFRNFVNSPTKICV